MEHSSLEKEFSSSTVAAVSGREKPDLTDVSLPEKKVKLLEEEKKERKDLDAEESDWCDDDYDVDLTEKEYEKYKQQVEASDGFDVDNFWKPGLFCGFILPISLSSTLYKSVAVPEKCKLALSTFNEQNKTNYQFARVVKVNYCVYGVSTSYYITFEATNSDNVPDGTLSTATTTFQAEVATGLETSEVELVRIKETR